MNVVAWNGGRWGERDVEHRASDDHAPFVDVLETVADPQDVAFRDVMAGLLTLRLVDAWAKTPEDLPRVALRLTWRALSFTHPSSPSRRVLDRVLEAIAADVTGRDAHVPVRLSAYGRVLERHDAWPLATHVYRMVIRLALRNEQRHLLPDMYRRLGDSLARCGLSFEASAEYDLGRAVALEIGATTARLRLTVAQLGLASRRRPFGRQRP